MAECIHCGATNNYHSYKCPALRGLEQNSAAQGPDIPVKDASKPYGRATPAPADLVKRLRDPMKFEVMDVQEMCLEAADMIERLVRERDGLKSSLSRAEAQRDYWKFRY